MADLQMGVLSTNEVAEHIDQGLASLNARLGGDTAEDLIEGEFPQINRQWRRELADALDRACNAWDEFADALPGFREES